MVDWGAGSSVTFSEIKFVLVEKKFREIKEFGDEFCGSSWREGWGLVVERGDKKVKKKKKKPFTSEGFVMQLFQVPSILSNNRSAISNFPLCNLINNEVKGSTLNK